MLLKRQPRLVVFMIFQLLASSCLQRSVVKTGSIPHPSVPTKKTELSFGDYMRTVYKVEQENTAQAEEQQKKLLDTHPELAELAARIGANTKDIEARKTLAAAYLQEGLLWNAYALYEEIRILVPDDFDAELGLAKIWDKWGDNALARQYATTAISINAASADAHDLMGKIALHGNAANGAIAEFKLALQLNPDQPIVLANLGYGYMVVGNSTEAKAAFEKALSLDSTLVEARNNLGILLAQAGDYYGAFDQMQQVGKPEVALNNIGASLLFENKGVEAAEVLKKALQYDPNYEKAIQNLSVAHSLIPPPAFVDLPPFVERAKLPPAPDPAAESARRLSETVVHVDPGVFQGRIDSADVQALAGRQLTLLPAIQPATAAPHFATELQKTPRLQDVDRISTPPAQVSLLRLPEPAFGVPIQPPTETPRFAIDLQKNAPVVAVNPSAKSLQSGILGAAEPVVSLPIPPASEVPRFALELQKPPALVAMNFDPKPSGFLRASEPAVVAPIQPATAAPRFAVDLQDSRVADTRSVTVQPEESRLLRHPDPVVAAPIQPSTEVPDFGSDLETNEPRVAALQVIAQPELTAPARAHRDALQAAIAATDKALDDFPEQRPASFTPLQPVVADIVLSPENALTFLIIILMMAGLSTVLSRRIRPCRDQEKAV